MQAGQPRPCTQRKRRVRTRLSSVNADSFLVGNRCACLCQERCCRVFLQRQVVVGHIVPYLSVVAVVLPIIVVEVKGIGGLDDFVLVYEAAPHSKNNIMIYDISRRKSHFPASSIVLRRSNSYPMTSSSETISLYSWRNRWMRSVIPSTRFRVAGLSLRMMYLMSA